MGLVVKCGGTVIKNNRDIRNVAQFIKNNFDCKDGLVIVVGAVGGYSYKLLNEALSFNSTPSDREVDAILTTGEIVSAAKMALALQNEGIDAVSLNAIQSGIHTNSQHRNAKVKYVDFSGIKNKLSEGKVVVITGFQGVNDEGEFTTFNTSYGGSDLTAILVAGVLGWDCVLYKDIDGIYSVNPENYPRAKKLDILDYEEIIQAVCVGGKVVEPYAVEFAEKFGITIYVSSIGKDYREGTKISKKPIKEGAPPYSIMSFKDGITIFTFAGISEISMIGEIFEFLFKENIGIDIVIGENFGDKNWSLSISCENEDAVLIEQIINNNPLFKNISLSKQRSITSLLLCGKEMIFAPGIVEKVINVLNSKKIHFYNVSASGVIINVTLATSDTMRAVLALEDAFND